MNKNNYLTIAISIVIHIIFIVMLSLHVSVPNTSHNKTRAIKSFLYKKPITQVVNDPIKELEPEVQSTPEQPIPLQQIKQQTEPQPKKAPNIEPTPIAKLLPETHSEKIDKTLEANLNKNAPISPKNNNKVSAYNSLKSLSKSLNEDMLQQSYNETFQHRSASVMHGEQEPVPHSSKQLSPSEKKENATQQLSSDLKIIKGDDGVCYVEKDLSNIGMEGITVRESFSCGESKFDKNFREHMKKAMKKYNK